MNYINIDYSNQNHFELVRCIWSTMVIQKSFENIMDWENYQYWKGKGINGNSKMQKTPVLGTYYAEQA